MRLVVLASAVLALASACASIEPAPQATKPAPEQKPEPKPFAIDGYCAEACSCGTPCPCELTGPIMSCKGVGAYVFTQGNYGGEDFSGARVAYSLYIGQTVRLYIDAPDATKRAAAERFARVALTAFGPIQSVRDAKVELEKGRSSSFNAHMHASSKL